MGSESTTSHAGNSKRANAGGRTKATSAYSNFILVSIALIINYLIFSPVAQARWYDPERGMFISRDPALNYNPLMFPDFPNEAVASGNPKALHPYNFCYNDPINFVDPDGRVGGAAILIGIIVAGVILWLSAEGLEKYLDAAVGKKCDLGCSAQTLNNNHTNAESEPPLIDFMPKAGAPPSCNNVLCRARDVYKAGGEGATQAAANLIRFWNENCAKTKGKIN